MFDPAWINPSTKMYQNLSVSTQMDAFGMDLSESASKALQQGLLHALPFLMLIAIVAVTGFIQQRQIQGRNPNAQVNPQQQMIMKIMPIFLPVISFGLPAGLVLYFAVSNIYRICQQAFISHSIYGGTANGMTWKDMFGLGPKVTSGAKPKPKSTSKDSSKAKAKAIPASSRRHPQGQAVDQGSGQDDRPRPRPRRRRRRPAKTSAQKGGQPAPSKTSTRSSKDGSETATPAKAAAPETATDTGSTGDAGRRSEALRWHRCRLHLPAAAGAPKEEVAQTVEWVEITGSTVEEAKEAALDQLGVDTEDAEFEVLEEPKQGLFGRVRGQARVRARIRPTRPRPKVERRDRRKRGGNGGGRAKSEGADAGADRRGPRTRRPPTARRPNRRLSPPPPGSALPAVAAAARRHPPSREMHPCPRQTSISTPTPPSSAGS